MRALRARYFNTTGPNDPLRHYTLPPVPRLPEARALIDMDRYFVVHAPRQTGKTTMLFALAEELTAEGGVAALVFSCERAKVALDDYGRAESLLLDSIREAAQRTDWAPKPLPSDPWPDATPGSRLGAALSAWARRCPRRLVLFFDEIDALQGDSMISVLSQLRDGHNARPGRHPFPSSVILCGLRDVRDYKVASGGDPVGSNPTSPFNIIAKSLRMGDFTAAQIAELYGQHTQATGQRFTDEAVERVFAVSQGQPWLVNAIAHEIVFTMGVAGTVDVAQVEQAEERLVRARATHLDALAVRLHEPRVRRVIEPMIIGDVINDSRGDDLEYVRDLGLIARDRTARIANPIYREIIARVLGDTVEANVVVDRRSFVLVDGRLDFVKLLEEFAGFWRAHAEALVDGAFYRESAAHLILMAYLHRVVNGGGFLSREFGVGHGRVDLHVAWPYTDENGKDARQVEAVEMKLWKTGKYDTVLAKGLEQLDAYLARLGVGHGTLVIFDQRPDAPPAAERTSFEIRTSPAGRTITLLNA
jgi:hypothetical protein